MESSSSKPIPLPLTIALNKTIEKANETLCAHSVRQSDPQDLKKYLDTKSWLQNGKLADLEKRLDVLLTMLDDDESGLEKKTVDPDEIDEKLEEISDKVGEIKKNLEVIGKEKDIRKKSESSKILAKKAAQMEVELEVEARKLGFLEFNAGKEAVSKSEQNALFKSLGEVQESIDFVDIFPYPNERIKVLVQELRGTVVGFTKHFDPANEPCSSNTAAMKSGSTSSVLAHRHSLQ
uniref:PCRF domain-containing protein n=1 Tax=Bursaphelenchus xylophilus TaxID=6326 RepID=A0A1I7RTZ6_BURXY